LDGPFVTRHFMYMIDWINENEAIIREIDRMIDLFVRVIFS
jgi:hypothetical protein